MSKTYIVTPTWNNADYTVRCFQSIAENTKDYVIIWVDNGSNKEDVDMVQDFFNSNPDVPYEKILNKENLGFVKGTNQGMRLAMQKDAEFIVLQNNDTEVYADWLDRLIRIAKKDHRIGLVGPLASPSHGRQDINNVLKSRLKREFSKLPPYNHKPEEYAKIVANLYDGESVAVFPNIAFFSTLIKRELVEEIGYLSEDFGLGFGDDDDYCARVIEQGFTIHIAKDVFIFHNHRTTFKKHFSEEEIKEMGTKNKKILTNKHQYWKDLIERNPKNFKDLLRILRNINKEEGFVSCMRYLLRLTKYTIFRKRRSF
jgi:GT2 family glycosyltransferase